VAGCLEAEPAVGARDDDGAAGVRGRGDGYGAELAREEVPREVESAAVSRGSWVVGEVDLLGTLES
jgi:hypothetical protein